MVNYKIFWDGITRHDSTEGHVVHFNVILQLLNLTLQLLSVTLELVYVTLKLLNVTLQLLNVNNTVS